MGVGRNLLYKKEVFHRVGGFEKHEDILSGDDDLFVQEGVRGQNTGVCIEPTTFMYSEAKQTGREFYRQKTRHVSTSVRYHWVHKGGLALAGLGQMLFYPTFLFFCMLGLGWDQIIVFLVVFIAKWIQFNRVSKKLMENDLIWLFPLLDIAFSFYLWALMPKLFFNKQDKWN